MRFSGPTVRERKGKAGTPFRPTRPAPPLARILVIAGLIAASVLVLGLLRHGFPFSRPRPWTSGEVSPGATNVLLISLDTTRPDPLHACGGTAVPTPGLDRVRGGGFVLTQAVSPVPVTLAAHATLFTGRNPNHHGVRENAEYALPDGTPTLAGRFLEAGYTTSAFVAAFVLDSRFGLAQGFETYEDRMNGPEPWLHAGMSEIPGGTQAQRATLWLQKYAAERHAGRMTRPFFLFVHFFDAHGPYSPPAPFDSRYRDNPYLGELAYEDDCVGRILDALEQTGEAARTLVWVVSDHGESLGEHGEVTHSLFIYDATLRVVSLLRPPPGNGRYVAGQPRLVVPQQTGLVDVAPTLLEIAGIAQGLPAVDGHSLLPILSGRTVAERPLYCETMSPKVTYHWAPLFGVRTSDWKYIRAPISELYGLRADPREAKNVISAQPTETARLGRILDDFLAPDTGGGSAASRRVPTKEEQERMRSLGYLTGGPTGTGQAALTEKADERSLPDPKKMVRFFNEQHEWAKGLLRQGKFAEAARAFRQTLEIDPLNNSLLLGLAASLRGAGRPGDAGRYCARALAVEPHSPKACYAWGEALLAAQKPDSAALLFRRSLDFLPDSPYGWERLGVAQWQGGDLVSAGQSLERALTLGAEPVRTHGLLVRLYERSADTSAKARGHLEAFARLSRLDPAQARAKLPDAPDQN